ncbi:hypothetical protein EAH72_33415 [Pseudomonas caspiana]|nr:hypothetical protein [Pseudomonas caspiana]TPG88258.1 hypothetical protein EAH72_33415 [Pseudomonas caspiana]
MILVNLVLGFLAGAGLISFAVFSPVFMGETSDILPPSQEIAAAVGIVLTAACAAILWLLNSTSFGTLFIQAFIN